MNEEERRRLRKELNKDFPLRGRYKPGLEWTMLGAWPQNIVTSLVQMQNDIEKGNIRQEHRRSRERLEKDYPSDGSNRPPGTNERLKAKAQADTLLLNAEKNNNEDNASRALEEARKVINSNSSGDLGGGSSIGETNARASWLKATSNSPAAKSMTHGKPTFSDDERWNLQQQHREWKANRSGTTPSESTSQQLQSVPDSIFSTKELTARSNLGLPNFSNADFAKGAEIFKPGNLQGVTNFADSMKMGQQMGTSAASNAMSGAAQGMAAAAAKAILEKMFAPKKGDAGANTSQGALSGGQAWEKFYTGDEFTSLPSWYM